MRKKLYILLMAMCLTVFTAGCGDSKEASKEDPKKEEAKVEDEYDGRLVSVTDLDKYVKLGEYKGIDLKKSIDEVTDDQVEAQIQSALAAAAVEAEDSAALVENGDIVNIDYVGKKDGVEFDGGSAEKYDLNIGSGTFIEGFEEGLIGMKKGEVRDLNLTFPEEYPSEDLAGQAVVFTVTLNYIKQVPELTDEWVQANADVQTVDEYRAQVRETMEANNEMAADSTLMNTAWTQVMESSEILEYPTEDIENAVQEYKDTLASFAEQQEMTEEEFLESQNITEEAFNEECTEYAKYKVQQNLIVQAIMDKEKITLDDEECQVLAKEMAANYGAENIDALVAQYGQRAVDESVGLSRVCDFIIDNGNVQDAIATDDGKDGVKVDE